MLMFFLFVYDISKDRRRRKVAKLMEAHGARVQKSVFECDINKRQLISLVKRSVKVIDSKTDSLRVYKLCSKCRQSVTSHGVASAACSADALTLIA